MARKPHTETMYLQMSGEEFYKTLEGTVLSAQVEEGGKTVKKDVKLGEFLGAGTMGGVVKGTYDGKPVAVKILDPDLAKKKDKDFKERFAREVKTILELPRHENLLEAYFGGTDKGVDFLVTEFVEHISLDKGKDEAGKPFPLDYACEVIRKAGKGLAAAHHKFKAHRDIKPENILANSTATVIKLADFGLIKDYGNVRQTAANMNLIGTPAYMAPEQIRGQANMYSDQYSLGATFYQMITGAPPFEGPTVVATLETILREDPAEPQLINSDIPQEINDMIMRTLAKDWRQRYITVAELVEEIEMLQNHVIPLSVLENYAKQNKEAIEKEKDINKLFFKSLAETGCVNLTKINQYGRGIVEKCWELERNVLISQLNSLKPSTESDATADLVTVMERLLRITPRKKQNVLERISWLKTLRKIYSDLAVYNPDVQVKKQSADNRMAWEINRRKYLNVEEPKTFVQKHGKKIRAAGLAAVVLMLVGAVGHIAGTTVYKRAEQKKTEARISQLETEITEILESAGDTDKNETEIRQKINLLRRLNPDDEKTAEIEQRFEAKKKEAGISRVYASAKTKITEAQKAIEESKNKNCTIDERNTYLQKASNLAAIVEKEDLKNLTGEKEKEIEKDIKRINEEIGPRKIAFENYTQLEADSAGIEKAYSALEAQLDKEEFFSKETIKTLKEKNKIATYILMGIGAHFLDESYRPTPAFQKLADRIKQQETQIALLEKRLYTKQIEKARQNAEGIETIIAWQKENKLSEEAAVKDQEAAQLRKQTEALLGNIDPNTENEYALEITGINKRINSVFQEYASVQEQIIKLADLRKRAKAGNIDACADLGKQFFIQGERDQAQKYFQQITETKNEEAIKAHSADAYLKTIALEKILKDETKSIFMRGNLAESEINRYGRQVEDYLGAKNLDSTEIGLMLGKLEKIPELQNEITPRKNEIYSLFAESSRLMAVQKTLEDNPENQELKKEYDAKLNEFLEKAKQHKPLRELGEKAREYLSQGSRETNPDILYEIAGCYEQLDMTATAANFYEKYLELAAKYSLIDARERKEVEEIVKELKK